MTQDKPKTPLKKLLSGKLPLVLLAAVAVLLLLFGGGEGKTVTPETGLDAETYRQTLTADLTETVSRMGGVSDVHLLLTLVGDGEAVYAKESNGTYILRSGEGLLLYRKYPAVSGVAVTCRGGDDPAIQAKITSLLSSLLGIGTNRIAVAGI